MAELLSCDTYQVYMTGCLSPNALSVLSQLYQPLIGSKAYSLYLLLVSEVDVQKMVSIESTHSRLCALSSLSLNQIKENRQYLEGIGLLKTYIKYENNITKYMYELIEPLDAFHFFNNELLNVLLYRTLGSLEYDKTRFLFRIPDIDFTSYDEITANFNEVYYIDGSSLEGCQVLKYKGEYRQEKSQNPMIQYPLDLFYKELQELQVRRRLITPVVETKVKQLGVAYHISGQQMANLVYESIDQDHIDLELLAKKVRTYYELETPQSLSRVYHHQPIQYTSSLQEDNAKTRHIRQLETWSPYKLIERKQGGKPVRRDLAIVEKLMVDLNLEPGVVNVLLELSWSQNDERISRDFVEAIGATWKRKNIHTVTEAMNEARNYIKYKNSRQNQDLTPEWFKQQQAEQVLENTINQENIDASDISEEELRELLKRV